MRLTLATHNEHKLNEFARLLPGYDLVALPPGSVAPVEDGDSFAANALIKARAGAAISGSATVADDSGICVQSLGAPRESSPHGGPVRVAMTRQTCNY